MAAALDIGKAIDAAIGMVDKMHVSQEERASAMASLTSAKAQAVNTVLEFEGRIIDAQARIIESEAKSESGFTRMWRPILMLGFGFIVFWNMVMPTLGLKPLDAEAAQLTPELWGLLKLGIGGYVIGRSGEKIVKSVAPAFTTTSEDLMKPKRLAKLKRKLAEMEESA